MKVKDLLSASPNAEIKIVRGKLQIFEPNLIEYKFEVGDMVYYDGRQYKIKERLVHCGEPSYKFEGHSLVIREWLIEISNPQDIIERIKTFEDACKWCKENGNVFLYSQYERISEMSLISSDLLAYLKLKIITAALNEGWEPSLEKEAKGKSSRWYAMCAENELLSGLHQDNIFFNEPVSLYFKSESLAIYAAKQFKEIYRDFCGYYGKKHIN